MVSLLVVAQVTASQLFKLSLLYTYLLKITGVFLVLMKYVLYQPLLVALVDPVWCSSTTIYGTDAGYSCFSMDHILLLAFSTLVVLLLSLLGVVTTLFLSDEQLDSRLPWAYMSQTYEFCKAVWKIAISIMLQFSHDNSSVAAYIPVVTATIGCVSMYELYRLTFMNDSKFFYATVTAEFTLMWFSFVVFVDIATGVNLGHPILLALALLLFIPLVVSGTLRSQDKELLGNTLLACTDPVQVEAYARMLYERARSWHNTQENSTDGLIAMHASSCKNSSCPCHDILIDQKDEDEEEQKQGEGELQVKVLEPRLEKPQKKAARSQDRSISSQSDAADRSVLCGLYSRFIIFQVEQWCRQHEEKAKLHLLLAYLKFFNCDNPLSALWEIMAAEEMSSDLYEQFHIWRLKYRARV